MGWDLQVHKSLLIVRRNSIVVPTPRNPVGIDHTRTLQAVFAPAWLNSLSDRQLSLEGSTLTLHRLIGEGGFGWVFEASLAGDSPSAPVIKVAVKVLQTVCNEAEVEHEARVLASFAHPNLLPIWDLGWHDGRPFLVVELAKDGSVAATPPAWTGRHVVSLLQQTMDALAHLHARKLVHGDLKPSNLLLKDPPSDDVPHLWVADLGQSLRMSEYVRPFPLAGTLLTMAPEQLLGHWRDVGPWTDVYGLGVVAYRWLTGRWPFVAQAATEAILARKNPLSPTGWGAAVDHVLGACLAFSPENRPARIADFGDELIEAIEAEHHDRTGLAESVHDLSSPTSGTSLTATHNVVVPIMPTPHTDPGKEAHLQGPWPVRCRPFTSWRLLDPVRRRAQTNTGRGLRGLRKTTYFGRGDTRDQLWLALKKADEGQDGWISLRGADGSGKDRTARWLMVTAAELGLAQWLNVDGDGPYPLCNALKVALGGAGLDGAVLRSRLEATLAKLGASAVGARDAAQVLSAPQNVHSHHERASVLVDTLSALGSSLPLIVSVASRGPEADAVFNLTQRRARSLGTQASGRAGILYIVREAGEVSATEKEPWRTITLGPLPKVDLVAFLGS